VRPYDTTNLASFSILSVSNKAAGDNLTVAAGVGVLAGASVGIQPLTNVNTLALGGTDQSNYSIIGATGNVTIGAWTATGFYSPIAPNTSFILPPVAGNPATGPSASSATVWNASKGGSAIPLKFDIFPNGASMPESMNVADVKSFVATQLSACSAAPEDPITDTGTPLTIGTSLIYDGEQFHQNWKTPKVNGDTCYRVTVTLQDNTAIHTFIKLKK